jgi:hypothetical protein
LESFLQISARHNIGIMFVLLDSCWNAYPALGPQPAPVPYIHNSQWVQAPGYIIVNDAVSFMTIKPYVTGVLKHFKNDSRVIAWCVIIMAECFFCLRYYSRCIYDVAGTFGTNLTIPATRLS